MQRYPFTTIWECSSGTAILDAVKHNIGLGVLSERCISDPACKKEVNSFVIEGVSMKRFFYICYNKNHILSSQMKDFINIAKTLQHQKNCPAT